MSDDLNPDVRRLVDLARQGRTPGEREQSRIAERLAVSLAASAAAGTAVGGAKAAAGAQVAGAAAKTASASMLAGIGVKIAAVLAVGAATTALVVGLGLREPKHGPITAPSQPSAATAPAMPALPENPAPALAESTDRADAKALEPAPAASKPAAPASARAAKPAQDLAEEAALLHEAQSAWRAGNSAQALRLASEHAERFPHSQLANERDVLRVLSLCKLGQARAAKQVGARLLRTAKGSPWYQSIADSCAAD